MGDLSVLSSASLYLCLDKPSKTEPQRLGFVVSPCEPQKSFTNKAPSQQMRLQGSDFSVAQAHVTCMLHVTECVQTDDVG